MAILAEPVRQITGARVASRGVNYPLLGLAFIGLAIAKLATVYWEMVERVPKIFFGAEGCTRYRDIMSPEDVIPVFEGVFVASSDERRQAMMRSIGAEASPWGSLFAIWNVDTPGQDPKTAALELEGFPEGTAFHPHGLHYRPETGELFVINHAWSQGGERIDVFKVSDNFPQDALPSVHPSLLEVTPTPPEEGMEGKKKPAIVDIGVAVVVLGSDGGDGYEAEEVDAVGREHGGPGDAAAGGSSEDEGGAAGGATLVEGGDAPEGDGAGVSLSDDGGGGDGKESGADTSDDVSGDSSEKVGSSSSSGGAEVVAQEEEQEELVESPKERAKRLKKEAKEAAAKVKADEKRRIADEKAAEKEAAAVKAARAKALSRGHTPFKLTYSFSVNHDFITTNYGVLNDIILVNDDELYVTQYLPMRLPLHGASQPDGILEHLRLYGSILLLMLQMSPAPIIRCTGIRGADVDCERLAKGRGVMYNGIALSPNGERLLVSDTATMQMVVFNRSLETGALTLRQRVDLPGSPDNLQLDLYRAAEGIEAYTVGLVSGSDFATYSAAMSGATDPSGGDEINMAGGFASIVFDNESGKYESRLEMWHDGSLLSISSAAATASGARLMGSAVEEGFLLCRPPPCPLDQAADGVCPWGPPAPPMEEEAEGPE